MDPLDEDLMYEDIMLLEGQIRDLKAENEKLRAALAEKEANQPIERLGLELRAIAAALGIPKK